MTYQDTDRLVNVGHALQPIKSFRCLVPAKVLELAGTLLIGCLHCRHELGQSSEIKGVRRAGELGDANVILGCANTKTVNDVI